MAQPAVEKLQSAEAASEDTLSKSVNAGVALNGQRQKIDTLLDLIEQKKGATKSTIQTYREAAKGEGQSAEGLEGFFDFIKDRWKEVEGTTQKITDELDRAVFRKVMTPQDRAFLLGAILRYSEKEDFAGHHLEIAEQVQAKIERAEDDKKSYDQILNHKLLKEGLTLTLKDGKKVTVLKEDAFMQKTLPERRELLKQWQEALKEGEKTTKAAEGKESVTLRERYEKKLAEAKKERWIGQRTAEKFLNRKPDGFIHQNLQTQKEYLSKFDAEMQKYRDFWKQVDSNLRPESQKQLHALIDQNGYSDLQKEYAGREQKDRAENKKEYSVKLKAAHKEGIIGKHTANEFLRALSQQTLKEQNHWNKPEVFAKEMERYRTLWQSIKTDLTPKQQKELKKMQDQWGYQELHERYLGLKNHAGSSASKSAQTKAERALRSRLQNDAMADRVVTSVEDQLHGGRFGHNEELFGNMLKAQKESAPSALAASKMNDKFRQQRQRHRAQEKPSVTPSAQTQTPAAKVEPKISFWQRWRRGGKSQEAVTGVQSPEPGVAVAPNAQLPTPNSQVKQAPSPAANHPQGGPQKGMAKETHESVAYRRVEYQNRAQGRPRQELKVAFGYAYAMKQFNERLQVDRTGIIRDIRNGATRITFGYFRPGQEVKNLSDDNIRAVEEFWRKRKLEKGQEQKAA